MYSRLADGAWFVQARAHWSRMPEAEAVAGYELNNDGKLADLAWPR